jgi:peptide/nickel transport system permease protein
MGTMTEGRTRWRRWGAAASRLLFSALAVSGVVSVLCFVLMRALPGDAAYRIAAGRYGYDVVDGEAAEMVRQELGLDQPGWWQLLRWLGDIAQGRLGVSLVSGESVVDELAHQLGHTLLLSFSAWGVSLALGLFGGVGLALLSRRRQPRLLSTLLQALKTTPNFVMALLLTTILAVQMQWLPAAGHGGVSFFVLPSLSLGLGLGAGLALVTQEVVAEVLRSPSVAFARTKGLPAWAVLSRHVLRNAAVPVATYSGTQLVWLIEGVVVVESFFAWPGIGHALVHALLARDIPVVQGTALCMGLLFVVWSAAVDALCAWLDPRLSAEGAR